MSEAITICSLFPTAYFVAKMSKIAITRFGGQVQIENTTVGRFNLIDDSGAGGPVFKP